MYCRPLLTYFIEIEGVEGLTLLNTICQLTVRVEPLYPGLEAAGLVDAAPGHGLPAHDVFPHGELGQLVPPAGAPEREELGDRVVQVQQHHLGRLAHRHPLVQQSATLRFIHYVNIIMRLMMLLIDYTLFVM